MSKNSVAMWSFLTSKTVLLFPKIIFFLHTVFISIVNYIDNSNNIIIYIIFYKKILEREKDRHTHIMCAMYLYTKYLKTV